MSSWADKLWSELVGSCFEVKVSAPGKVLIVGGYLVLDPRYPGLVIAVNARFTSRVALLPSKSESFTNALADYGKSRVVLISQQVFAQPLLATLSFSSSKPSVSPFSPKSNAFVENAINFSLVVLCECVPNLPNILEAGLAIYTYADAAFYSELDCDGVVKAKSGLGSSAALVASVTAALFGLFNVNNVHLCYRTAQLAHCAAQGKIGSGFDISAAFFGSQVYRRFDPKVISPILDCQIQSPITILSALRDDAQWSDQHVDLIMPEGIRIVLGDVQTGSETPGMVNQVLEWLRTQKSNCWEELNHLNMKFISILKSLQSCCSITALEEPLRLPLDNWEKSNNQLCALLLSLRHTFILIRHNLQVMGVEAGVDIEPALQTGLLDATMNIPGVICAGIPGAGGYDAIFAIYIGGEPTCNRIQKFWSEKNVNAIDVQQASNGLIYLQ